MTLLAVLGTGSIGLRHLRIFSALPGVDVYAIPARFERLGELKKAGYRAVPQLSDLPKVDAVVVATNTERHLVDVMAALRAGAHVLVEKPLAPAAEGVRAVLEFAARAKKNIYVGSCLRFDPALLAFKDLLPSIGRVYSVEISCRSYLPDWRPGQDYRTGYAADSRQGGVLRDLIHEVDYALWLYGSASKVSGRLEHSGLLEISTEDLATLMWTSAHGVSVSIHLDYLARHPVRRMTAFGSAGQICVDLVQHTVVLKRVGEEQKSVEMAPARDEMYLEQAKAFLIACAGESHAQLSLGEDGLAALAVCDAARQSSLHGCLEEDVVW